MDGGVGDLMQQAVKIRTATDATLRSQFDAEPKFRQASLFTAQEVQDSRSRPFAERMAVAVKFKNEGNRHFQEGQFEAAANAYEHAAAVFTYLHNKNPNWKRSGIRDEQLCMENYVGADVSEREVVKALKLSCYLNLGLTYYRMQDYGTCVQACAAALEVEPRSVKAYYRRAQALVTPVSAGGVEMDRAISDLESAHTLDPDDQSVKKLLLDLKAGRKRQMLADQRTFGGMFERGSLSGGAHSPVPARPRPSEARTAESEEDWLRSRRDTERLIRSLEQEEEEARREGKEEELATLGERVRQLKDILARDERDRKARAASAAPPLDWMNPTPEMIVDAGKEGINLNDPEVRRMMAQMQRQRDSGRPGEATSTPQASGTDSPISPKYSRELVQMSLKQMNREELQQTLQEMRVPVPIAASLKDLQDLALKSIDAVAVADAAGSTSKTSLPSAKRKGRSSTNWRVAVPLTVCIVAFRLYSSGLLGDVWGMLERQVSGPDGMQANPAGGYGPDRRRSMTHEAAAHSGKVFGTRKGNRPEYTEL